MENILMLSCYHRVAQGFILGPLLFIIYMNDEHRVCKYFHAILFAHGTNLNNIICNLKIQLGTSSKTLLLSLTINNEFMMTSSNGNIFRVPGHLCGEFTGEFPTQRPATRSVDVFFDLHLIKRLSKHSWGWWFETLSPPLWRYRNGNSHKHAYG